MTASEALGSCFDLALRAKSRRPALVCMPAQHLKHGRNNFIFQNRPSLRETSATSSRTESSRTPEQRWRYDSLVATS